MRRFAAVLFATACGPQAAADDCYGVCGDGTRCAAGKCVPAPAATAEPTVEPAATDKAKRRGRSRGGARGADDELEAAPSEADAIVDDASVPAYDRNAEQTIDMKAGSERLPDETVRAHMRQLEPQFDRCIAAAVGRGAEVSPGRVDFAFAVEPDGRVGGVEVRAPASLKDAGVVPCLRKAVHDHRFPRWDGPRADVEYSFRVE